MPTASLSVGQTVPVQAIPKDSNENPGQVNGLVTWSSSDAAVASVEPGSNDRNVIVRANSAGVATISAGAQAIPSGPIVSSSLNVTANPLPFTHFVFQVGSPS